MCGRGEKRLWLWCDATVDAEAEEAWKPITSDEAYGTGARAGGAVGPVGREKGRPRGALSENRWEWPVTDFAVLALGAVDVPLYTTLTAEQVGYMLRDCGAKVAVVSSWEQVEKVRAAGELPALQHVLVMDEMEPEQATVSSPTHPTPPAKLAGTPDRDEAAMNGAPGVFAVESFCRVDERCGGDAVARRGVRRAARARCSRTISPPSSTPLAPPESPRA